MKKTYKYRLPKDAEVSQASVRVENGEVLVDVELKEKFEPKDGDFLTVKSQVFIYNGRRGEIEEDGVNLVTLGAHVGTLYGGAISLATTKNMWARLKDCRYATEKEKKVFLERLAKECGLRWNPETKKTEKIRWRADKGLRYYSLNYRIGVVEMTEIRGEIDEGYSM